MSVMKSMLICYVPLLVVLLTVTAYEIRTFVVPDTAIVVGLIGGLIASRYGGLNPWWSHWAAVLCCPLMLYAASVVWEKTTGMVMIGMGLVKLSAVVGAFVGLPAGLAASTLFVLATVALYFVIKAGGPSLTHGTPLILGAVVLAILIQSLVLQAWHPDNKASHLPEDTARTLADPQQ